MLQSATISSEAGCNVRSWIKVPPHRANGRGMLHHPNPPIGQPPLDSEPLVGLLATH